MDYYSEGVISAVNLLSGKNSVERGHKGEVFLDMGYLAENNGKIRNAEKRIKGSSIPYPCSKHKILDMSGFFHSCKKGFILEDYSILYCDQFYKKPIHVCNLAEIKRNGQMLTFIQKDGTQTSADAGKVARYLECFFLYAIAYGEGQWRGPFDPVKWAFESAMREDILGYYNSDIETWEEYRSRYATEVVIPLTFEEAKEKALAGDYEMAIKVCKDFKDSYPYEEKGKWALQAVLNGLCSGVKQIEKSILYTLFLGSREGRFGLEENCVNAYWAANLQVSQYGKEGFDEVYELLTESDGEKLRELVIDGDVMAAEQYNNFVIYELMYLSQWPDISVKNIEEEQQACDVFCNSFATDDTELIQAFRNALNDPYSIETEELYYKHATESQNPYAMYMYYSLCDYEKKIFYQDYLIGAAIQDYPPVLYELGLHLSKKVGFDSFGDELIKRAAARGYGAAAEYLLEAVRNKQSDLSYEQILEYAEAGIARNDYNAMHVKAVIHEFMKKDDWFALYHKAAEAGHIASAEFLFFVYRDEQNPEQAYKWLQIMVNHSTAQQEFIDDDMLEYLAKYKEDGYGMLED